MKLAYRFRQAKASTVADGRDSDRLVKTVLRRRLPSGAVREAMVYQSLFPASLVSILNQILRSIQRFPQCLKSVRIVAFAFLLGGGVPKSADRRTQTFDCLIPEMQGFRQGMFQGFALGIEGLLRRWRNRDVCSLGESQT
jgi:hypothetical protein